MLLSWPATKNLGETLSLHTFILYMFGGVFDWYYCSGTTSIIELEGRTGSLEKELATKDSYIRELEDIIMEKVKKYKNKTLWIRKELFSNCSWKRYKYSSNNFSFKILIFKLPFSVSIDRFKIWRNQSIFICIGQKWSL